MRHARIVDGRVVEIFTVPDGYELAQLFHPDIVATMRPCDDGVGEGWTFDGSAFAAPAPVLVDLARMKTLRKAEIDAEAEAQRLHYITPGAGQAMTYSRKVEQARAVEAASDPQPSQYPLLAASIGIDGVDLKAVAATVLLLDAQWEVIGAAIERARLQGKRAIDLATDALYVDAVTVTWPEPPFA